MDELLYVRRTLDAGLDPTYDDILALLDYAESLASRLAEAEAARDLALDGLGKALRLASSILKETDDA